MFGIFVFFQLKKRSTLLLDLLLTNKYMYLYLEITPLSSYYSQFYYNMTCFKLILMVVPLKRHFHFLHMKHLFCNSGIHVI